MKTVALFQKVWVVESLPDGELKTGRALVEGNLTEATRRFPDLEVSFEKPSNREEFLSVLDRVCAECVAIGKFPLLHIECHGCPDGLQMASGEVVNWSEIREQFISINSACRLNLVVVLAACYGADVLNLATKLDRAPFWAAIAPEKEVNAGHVQAGFEAFYGEFFKELNGDAAIAALNHQDADRVYHFFSIRRFFLKAYREYYSMACRGKGQRDRVEDLVSQAMRNPHIADNVGVAKVRQLVKEQLGRHKEDFERMVHSYFMIDLYPENADRFRLDFNEVIQA